MTNGCFYKMCQSWDCDKVDGIRGESFAGCLSICFEQQSQALKEVTSNPPFLTQNLSGLNSLLEWGSTGVRIVLPLALSEPEPTLPFGLSLSEPTYQHLPTFLGLLNINFTEKIPKIIFFNV